MAALFRPGDHALEICPGRTPICPRRNREFYFRTADVLGRQFIVPIAQSMIGKLLVIGLSHHSSPVTVRERFAFAEARVPAALQLLRDSGAAEEAVILSTCNRVEIYAVTSQEPRKAFAALQEFLVKCNDYRDPLTDELYTL